MGNPVKMKNHSFKMKWSFAGETGIAIDNVVDAGEDQGSCSFFLQQRTLQNNGCN